MAKSQEQVIRVTVTLPIELHESIIKLADKEKESKSAVVTQLISTGMRIALAPTVDFGTAIESLNKSYLHYTKKKQKRINKRKSSK